MRTHGRTQCPRSQDLKHVIGLALRRMHRRPKKLALCKIDGKMAHKRIKNKRKDYKYLCARFRHPTRRSTVYISNTTGTYGVSIAQ